MSILKGWTDYPIIELGDVPGQLAPVRQVEIHGWDGDKYACVTVEGMNVAVSFKRFYLYSKPGRIGEVPAVDENRLRVLSLDSIFALCGDDPANLEP